MTSELQCRYQGMTASSESWTPLTVQPMLLEFLKTCKPFSMCKLIAFSRVSGFMAAGSEIKVREARQRPGAPRCISAYHALLKLLSPSLLTDILHVLPADFAACKGCNENLVTRWPEPMSNVQTASYQD